MSSSRDQAASKLSLQCLRCHFILQARIELEISPSSCPPQQLHWFQKHHSTSYQPKARQVMSFSGGQGPSDSQWDTLWSIRLFWIS